MTQKKNMLVVTQIVVDDEPTYSLTDICDVCDISPSYIYHLVEYGILDVENVENTAYALEHLQRIKRVQRLQRDLEINLAGAALVLDLMDEIEDLRRQLQVWEKFSL